MVLVRGRRLRAGIPMFDVLLRRMSGYRKPRGNRQRPHVAVLGPAAVALMSVIAILST
jgi:hypothetical protein